MKEEKIILFEKTEKGIRTVYKGYGYDEILGFLYGRLLVFRSKYLQHYESLEFLDKDIKPQENDDK